MLAIQSAQQLSAEQLQTLYEIILTAYRETEAPIWGPDFVRLSWEEFAQSVERGEIWAAFYEGEVVGGMRCRKRQPGRYTFGLLAARFDKSGRGIGLALIEQAEQIARANGAVAMEIEVLRTQTIPMPNKVRLSKWYQRLGYRITHRVDFSITNPKAAQKLANPSIFDYYRKKLH